MHYKVLWEIYCFYCLSPLLPILHSKESGKTPWNPATQNLPELHLPKIPGSLAVPITHPVRSQSCSSCKPLSSVRDTSMILQGVYKKYEWAQADPFIKILGKWEVAFLTPFLRKWVLRGGTCLPVPPPSPNNLPAQGQISTPSGQQPQCCGWPLTTPCVVETRDLGEITSFSPMEGKAGSKLNFCQALEKQHRTVLNDTKHSSTQTCSQSLLGFGHNWIEYGDYSLSEQPILIWGLSSPPASQLALPFPRVSSPHYAWISPKGPPAAFLSEIKPFLRVQHSAKHHQPLR